MKKNKQDKSKQVAVLYDSYEQKVYALSYSILRSVEQAEDATQETFIQLYQQLTHIATLGELETKRYILRVAKNKAIDSYRKNQRQLDFLSNYQERQITTGDNVDSHLNELMSEEQFGLLLTILPKSYQQVFMYRVYFGLNTREVSELLGLTEVNTRKQYERAKKKIITMMGGTDYDNIGEVLKGIN